MSESSLHWHRRVLGLAFPIVLANLTQPLLGLVDTAVAGHLSGAQALGGVALGGLFFSAVYWSFGFLRMGTTGLVAHAFGARDARALRLILARALLLALSCGMVIIAFQSPLIRIVIDLIGGSEAVRASARAYCRARVWAAPFALANYVLLGYLLGCQRVRIALLIQVLINLVNILGVYGFVYGLHGGVAGIGAATALADIIGFLIGGWLLWRMRPATRQPIIWSALWERSALKKLFTLNRDIFLRTWFLLLSVGWFAHIGARQSDAILAANALLLNFQTFMTYGLDGFAHAAEALVGEAFGARRREALRQAMRTTAIWSVIGAIMLSAVYAVSGDAIIAQLTNQSDIRVLAHAYLPWVVVLPLASVGGYWLDGVFIGAMRTRDLMQAMAICLAIFLTAAWLCVTAWGNHGLWLAFTLFMISRTLILLMRLPALRCAMTDPAQ